MTNDASLEHEYVDHLLHEVLANRMTRRQLLVRASALGLSATALGSLVAACGSSTSTATSSSASSNTPKNGGTLRVSYQGEPATLDPAVEWPAEGWSMNAVMFDGLITYASAPGMAGTQLVGDIATEVPSVANGGITNGGKTYTFHMRSDVKFAPPVNRVVTADDVKWSIERMMRVPMAPATYFYDGIVGATEYGATNSKATQITGIKVVDPTTIEFDLTDPDPTFLYKLTMPFCYVMDKGTVAKYGSQIGRHPLGTGPFMMASWTPGQKIVLTRNPNYYDPAKVHLDGIDFIFGANAATALLQLERGNIDVLGAGVPPASFAQVTHDPQFKKDVISAPEIAWYYVFINTKIKPFDNVLVRQAVNYAVNTQKLMKVMAGQAQPLNQLYPVGLPGHDSSASFYSYDPVKAKALLAQAGFASGFQTTLYTENVDPWPAIAQSVQYDLQQIGVNSSLKELDQATYYTLISTKGNPCALGMDNWIMDFPDPADWYTNLFSKASSNLNGTMNDSWWYSPQAEDLYTQTLTEPDPAKRIQLFQQIQKIIMAQAPVVPLCQPVYNGMASANVGGYYFHPIWQWAWADYWKK